MTLVSRLHPGQQSHGALKGCRLPRKPRENLAGAWSHHTAHGDAGISTSGSLTCEAGNYAARRPSASPVSARGYLAWVMSSEHAHKAHGEETTFPQGLVFKFYDDYVAGGLS